MDSITTSSVVRVLCDHGRLYCDRGADVSVVENPAVRFANVLEPSCPSIAVLDTADPFASFPLPVDNSVLTTVLNTIAALLPNATGELVACGSKAAVRASDTTATRNGNYEKHHDDVQSLASSSLWHEAADSLANCSVPVGRAAQSCSVSATTSDGLQLTTTDTVLWHTI